MNDLLPGPGSVDLSMNEQFINVGDREYLLREASSEAACKYRNFLLGNVQLGPTGKPEKLGTVADAEPLLVSLCLFEIVKRDPMSLKRIPLATVKAWPNRAVKNLFTRVQEMSDLAEEESQLSSELRDALNHPSSPVTLTDLREHVDSFPQDRLTELRELIKATPEELAKNEQTDTLDGSD